MEGAHRQALKATEFDPDNFAVRYNLALALEPNDPKVLFYLARSLEVLGRLDEAIIKYRKGIALDPENTGANLRLVDILIERMAPTEIIAEYREASELSPDSGRFLVNRRRRRQWRARRLRAE